MRCLKHNHNHKVDQLTQLSLQIQAQELFSAVSGVNLLCGSFLVDIALAPCIILFCVCVSALLQIYNIVYTGGILMGNCMPLLVACHLLFISHLANKLCYVLFCSNEWKPLVSVATCRRCAFKRRLQGTIITLVIFIVTAHHSISYHPLRPKQSARFWNRNANQRMCSATG